MQLQVMLFFQILKIAIFFHLPLQLKVHLVKFSLKLKTFVKHRSAAILQTFSHSFQTILYFKDS